MRRLITTLLLPALLSAGLASDRGGDGPRPVDGMRPVAESQPAGEPPPGGAPPSGGKTPSGEELRLGGEPRPTSGVRPGSRARPGAVWPVGDPPRVVRGWAPPASPYGPGHRGVDLAASAGATVRAVASGRVVFAGPVGGRGVLVVELSGTGVPPLRTTYEPVRPLLKRGAEVTAGRAVAVLAEEGPFHCPSPCLHWGLRRADAYLDPLSLIRRTPPRLLPVFGVPEPPGGSRER